MFAFYENEKAMTRLVFPYCCGDNREEILLLESCCTC